MRRVKNKSYAAKYRSAHGLVQLNCNILRPTKEKLDKILNKTGQTTAEFIEQSVETLDRKEESDGQ